MSPRDGSCCGLQDRHRGLAVLAPGLKVHLPHLVLVVLFFSTGFCHLQLSLVHRSLKEYFWIGVVALLMGLRQVGLGGWLEEGPFSPGLLNRLEWANFFCACMAFVAFMRVLSREMPRPWLRRFQYSFLVPEALEPKAGHGLSNLRHRAEFLGGQIVFGPGGEGKGFQARISVPV